MDALYQKQILQFAQQSRTSNFDPSAPLQASYNNPTCGDRVDISFSCTDGVIHDIGVTVRGCALSEAGAGLLLKKFEGCSTADARKMTADFTNWIAKLSENAPNEDMEKFMPVREIRNRQKCVLLAFDAAIKAMD